MNIISKILIVESKMIKSIIIIFEIEILDE